MEAHRDKMLGKKEKQSQGQLSYDLISRDLLLI